MAALQEALAVDGGPTVGAGGDDSALVSKDHVDIDLELLRMRRHGV